MAPEVFRGDDYNHKADVFSFAILAFEALNLIHPFILYVIDKKLLGRQSLGKNILRSIS